mgnify:CR=1 FL=1
MGRGDLDAIGCILAVLQLPVAALVAAVRAVRRRRAPALGGTMPCPHCDATVYLDGRAQCPACSAVTFGSFLACHICGWRTNALDCPTCKATIFFGGPS